MARDTLLDFFDERIRSGSTFIVYDDGYRAHAYSYAAIRDAASRCAARLHGAGVRPNDNVVLWGENRAEWIVAFWGCLLARAVVVPLDFRTSPDLVARLVEIVAASVVIVGDEIPSAPATPGAAHWRLDTLLSEPNGRQRDAPAARGTRDDLAEIIFTSGATADPKGVEITHANILANIVPVEREVRKYLKYGRPFFPLRFLNLLPLSHMFGQAMATFVPPMMQGVTVFMRGYNPNDIVRQISTRRVSVLVCVPKILEVLRDHLIRVAPDTAAIPAAKPHVAIRWWRHRRVHRLFGYKFWAFVVGAAPLDPELEEFWSRLGFLVIQGYGLTETAPIVTLNHPFRARQGSVGTPMGGVELSIADDGEILVRGANVTRGYYNAPAETAEAFRDGWFHTGDVGSIDASGRLSVRGRKKEMIVTADGRNVFPEDVERVLTELPGVREAGVIGASIRGEEQVHAVVVLEPGTDPDTIVREANGRLEEHQRVRACSVWPSPSLPRTEGLGKLRRRELKRWVDGAAPPNGARTASPPSVDAVVAEFARGRRIVDTTSLDELGLSSLDRIELMMALERELDRSVDEMAFAEARTIADLRALLAGDGAPPATAAAAVSPVSEPITFPTWSRRRPVSVVRRLALSMLLLPLTRVFAWIRVEGLDRLDAVSGPVVFAANHQSHLDAPVILAALPPARRYTLATAAALEWFSPHFHPDRFGWLARMTSGLSYGLAVSCFNVVPLPQREAGARDAMRYLGELVADGASVLLFPEGLRTSTGEIAPFRPGIGMIASRLRVPVVPVHLEGIDRIWHQSWRMARPGRARVTFGAPLTLSGDDYRVNAQHVEDAVRALA